MPRVTFKLGESMESELKKAQLRISTKMAKESIIFEDVKRTIETWLPSHPEYQKKRQEIGDHFDHLKRAALKDFDSTAEWHFERVKANDDKNQEIRSEDTIYKEKLEKALRCQDVELGAVCLKEEKEKLEDLEEFEESEKDKIEGTSGNITCAKLDCLFLMPFSGRSQRMIELTVFATPRNYSNYASLFEKFFFFFLKHTCKFEKKSETQYVIFWINKPYRLHVSEKEICSPIQEVKICTPYFEVSVKELSTRDYVLRTSEMDECEHYMAMERAFTNALMKLHFYHPQLDYSDNH